MTKLYHFKISYPREVCVFSDNKVTTAFTNRIKFFGSEQLFLEYQKKPFYECWNLRCLKVSDKDPARNNN